MPLGERETVEAAPEAEEVQRHAEGMRSASLARAFESEAVI